MNHIFIYGPPGSGKTTVGYTLAQRLELPFIDLDHAIEIELWNDHPIHHRAARRISLPGDGIGSFTNRPK